MRDFIELLNQNAGALNLLFSGVVALATVVYATLTAWLVLETRKLRQAQTEPHVEVFYRPRDEWISLLDIVVKNIGAGPAYDLKFSMVADESNKATHELLTRLSELKSIENGISFLGPGQEFASFWTSMVDQFDQKMQAKIVITSSFLSTTGDKYTRKHVVDLSELKGLQRIGKPPLLKIAESVEQLQKDVGSLAKRLT